MTVHALEKDAHHARMVLIGDEDLALEMTEVSARLAPTGSLLALAHLVIGNHTAGSLKLGR